MRQKLIPQLLHLLTATRRHEVKLHHARVRDLTLIDQEWLFDATFPVTFILLTTQNVRINGLPSREEFIMDYGLGNLQNGDEQFLRVEIWFGNLFRRISFIHPL
ncbi:hypothetical protein TNCV_4935381 [Trichonephila clavipes]|nr:hypothetical protein TNCV_4935381 [Trichonephila clavipes]